MKVNCLKSKKKSVKVPLLHAFLGNQRKKKTKGFFIARINKKSGELEKLMWKSLYEKLNENAPKQWEKWSHVWPILFGSLL